ncbi:MAG: TIR domain-containing protein [Anaerolineales bacterium]
MTPPQTGRIFISYRRADSAGYAGRIYDRLAAHFGKDAIFMDVDTIEAGLDFVEVLENAVQSCDVLVALIGRQWLNIKDDTGIRRLDNPQDFVRIEVAAALNRSIRVIPVLVDGTPMPNSDQLPSNLKLLARRNAVPVTHYSFHNDANRLIEQLELALKAAEESKFLKAEKLKEKEAQEKRKAEIENLLSQADIALDLQDWELAQEKLEAVLMLEPEQAQAQVKLAIVERKLREKEEKHLADEEAKQEAAKKAEQERKAHELLELEERARKKREFVEREKTDREAAEKAAMVIAEQSAAEKAEREDYENATRDKAESKVVEKAALEKVERDAAGKAFQQKASQFQTFLRQLWSKNRNWKAAVIVSFFIVLSIFGINYLTRQLVTNDGSEASTELNTPVNVSTISNPVITTEELSCTECHNDTTLITGKRFAWSESLHGSGETFVRGTINSCAGCHSGGAFSERIVTGLSPDEVEFGDPNPTRQDCRACHQIHITYSSNDWALESTDSVNLYAFEGITFDGGKGNLCANCHQPRRNFPAPVGGMITEITEHWGPHHGPQSAILLGVAGAGSVEGSPSAHYQMAEDTCVTCHMGDGANHIFEPDIAVCQNCHADAENFDINSVQTEVQAMLDELGDLLVAYGVLSENSPDGHPTVTETPENVAIALWNWIYVAHEDKSLGVHNPAYTRALLEGSFEALNGQ